MQRATRLLTLAPCLALALALALSLPATARTRVAFKHEVVGGGERKTVLDHPLLNGNPSAIIIVNQTAGTTDPHPIDVIYFDGHWEVWNSEPANIPDGTVFDVLILDSASAFVHTTAAGNLQGHVTNLDHPLLNGRANARPQVTVRVEPLGTSGNIGTWYNAGTARWTIFHQDTTVALLAGLKFNVFVPGDDETTIIHTATPGNSSGDLTAVSHPQLDASHGLKPHLFATQRWIGVYNDHPIGVSWLFSWFVHNADGADMPENAAFNLYIAPIFADGFENAGPTAWSSVVCLQLGAC